MGIEKGKTSAPPGNLPLRHLRFGWWSLLLFASLGLLLEALHGLKAGFYLDTTSETRRLMWTLAHAHGTLISLVHLGFAFSLQQLPHWQSRSRPIASGFLCSAGILLPGGFFLGGLKVYGGDPGIGILLVPVGALLLISSALLTARAFR